MPKAFGVLLVEGVDCIRTAVLDWRPGTRVSAHLQPDASIRVTRSDIDLVHRQPLPCSPDLRAALVPEASVALPTATSQRKRTAHTAVTRQAPIAAQIS